ncbi:MAG: hypothetical protein ABSF44_12090 [Candidatus Bathyarchaeia archaeon]
MGEDIDILIQREETKLLPFCSRMEEFKTEFIKETIDFASEWFGKTTKEYITKYPEVTLNMSEEKIARMKLKITELIGNSEKIVKGELENPDLWWHQKPHLHDSIEQYTQVADKYPEILDRSVRHALGQLGVVLEEFRFRVTASGNTGSYEEFWFEHPVDSDKTIPMYPHLLKWTEEMQDTIRKYNSQFVQAMKLYDEIQNLKEQKKKQQAMARWESI